MKLPKATSRIALVAAGAAVVALHVALLSEALPWKVATGDAPITGADYDTHIGQTYRLMMALDGWGKTWCYDVSLLAGHPANTIFDGDNKGWALASYGLWKLGVSRGQAFNLFVLLSTLSIPLVVMGSAALMRLRASVAITAGGLAVSLWHFDSFARWMWWVGMNAFAYGSVLLLLPLAIFARMLERPRLAIALVSGTALGLCHLIHPFVFFILAPSMATAYALKARTLSKREHAWVGLVGALTIAINGHWIFVALKHWNYVLDSAYFVQGGPVTMLADFFGLLIDPTDTGVIGTRTGFRFLCFALTGVALVIWQKERDPRLLPPLVATGTGLFFAYLGRYVPGAGQMQPYRHILPAAFVATIPAAFVLDRVTRARFWRGLSGPALGVLWIAIAGTALHLASDARYFLAYLLPTVKPLMEGDPSPLYAHGHMDRLHFSLPHDDTVETNANVVARWIANNVERGDRVLIEDIAVGERVAWQAFARQSGVEVIGGFRERNIVHSYANPMRKYQGKVISESELRKYLSTYSVDWVISHQEHREFASMPDTLGKVRKVAGRQVYRNLQRHDRMLEGGGEIEAATNRLRVRGSDPNSVLVLSYHHHPDLRCKPGCRVERQPIELDEAGLIRIPAPHPADLTIYNGY